MMLKVHNLTKKFKNKEVLKKVSLELDKGIVGLLGPNGAGKTTLIRIICSIIKPSDGFISYDNMCITKKNLEKYRGILGYMPQELGFYKMETVKDYLEYYCVLDNILLPEIQERISEVLKIVNLSDKKKTKISNLSGGMKRRLGFAQAIIRKPSILVLDEPTVGLDPEERRKMRNLIYDYGKEAIVILSTHLTEDIENICDRVLILDKGNLVINTTLSALISESASHIYQCDNESCFDNIPKENIISQKNIEGKRTIRFFSDKVLDDQSYKLVAPTLEDAYLYIRER